MFAMAIASYMLSGKQMERLAMRMMLKFTIPTEIGNRAIKDSSLPKLFEAIIGKLKPEASYFLTDKGLRCGMIFFDMRDASDIPGIAEPLFTGLNAELEFVPVMDSDDLKKGLDAAARALRDARS